MDYGSQVEFLRRQHGKTLVEVETHLVSENTFGSGTGAVAFDDAFGFDFAEQIEVLLHVVLFYDFTESYIMTDA